jgi:hypothetical protein
MTEPTDAEMEEFWLRLRLIIELGLERIAALHGAETALAMRWQFATGQWRLRTDIGVDADKQPVSGSLRFLVDIHIPFPDEVVDEWEEFAAIRPSALGVPPHLAEEEARWTALQHGIGLPDNLSGLDDP